MKISVTNLLGRKRKLNIVLLTASLLLMVSFVAIATTKNAKDSKAAGVDACPNNICTISGAGVFRIDSNPTWDNKDLVIDGSTVIVSGAHHFVNLTIRNGGVLTHDVLVANTDFDASAAGNNAGNPLTVSGLAKKIDLAVDGTVTLNGGKIFADGKGYPGGVGSVIGYGPGGGPRCNTFDDDCHAGGGSYGGRGGAGGNRVIVERDNPPYGNQNFPSDHGSGGGGGAEDGSPATGGAGGGIILIKTGTITISSDSSITADGLAGSQNGGAFAGAGAGGSIQIFAKYINGATSGFEISAMGGKRDEADPLNNGTIVALSMLLNVRAEGGTPNNTGGSGAGGGGRISINPGMPGSSVKKNLEPIERLGAGNDGDLDGNENDNFNPYTLQNGDTIRVNLDVHNLVPNSQATVKEEIMRLSNGFGCIAVGEPSNGGIADAYKIIWTLSSNQNGEILGINYNCKVQQIEGI